MGWPPFTEERFWANGRRDEQTGCLLWLGACNGGGYGNVRRDGKLWTVHVLSWTLTHGPVPHPMWVLHECDVKRCYEPEHLFLGTQRDNNRHASAHGLNGKLTPDQVVEIKQRIQASEPNVRIAEAFGVSRQLIRGIKHGHVWRDYENETWKEHV